MEILRPFDQIITSDSPMNKNGPLEEDDSMNSKFVSITHPEFLSQLNSHLASTRQLPWRTLDFPPLTILQDSPGHSHPETVSFPIGTLHTTLDPDMPKRTKKRSSMYRREKELNKIASAKNRYKNKMIKLYENNFIQRVIDENPKYHEAYRILMESCQEVIRSKFEEYDQLKESILHEYGTTRTYSRSRVRTLQHERQESTSDTDSSCPDLFNQTVREEDRSLHGSTEQESS